MLPTPTGPMGATRVAHGDEEIIEPIAPQP